MLLRLNATRDTKFMKINQQVNRVWGGHICALRFLKPYVTIVKHLLCNYFICGQLKVTWTNVEGKFLHWAKVWSSLKPILISRLADNYYKNLKSINRIAITKLRARKHFLHEWTLFKRITRLFIKRNTFNWLIIKYRYLLWLVV